MGVGNLSDIGVALDMRHGTCVCSFVGRYCRRAVSERPALCPVSGLAELAASACLCGGRGGEGGCWDRLFGLLGSWDLAWRLTYASASWEL